MLKFLFLILSVKNNLNETIKAKERGIHL